MQITTNALLLGKPTIIKENQYLSTKDYVEDFLNFFEPIAKYFEINVQIPEQITGNISEKDITYNKVWIQAIMPDKDNIEDYNETYGLIYALDSKTPICKFYRAYRHSKTNNLCVFNLDWIETKELSPNSKFTFDFKAMMNKVNDFERKIKLIKNNFISTDHLNDLWWSLHYLTYNDVVNKPTSNYYVSTTTEGSYHNMYSSICNQITQGKDIVNRFEKTLLVGMLFNFIRYETNNKA